MLFSSPGAGTVAETGAVRKVTLNIVFDLGGVVVEWKPDAIIAKAFSDPALRSLARSEIIGHPDWLALDRGTLSQQDVIARAAKRMGVPEAGVAELLRQVPPALVAIPETVDLLYRLKARGHTIFCLSNMQAASIEHLEKTYDFLAVFEGVVISSRLQLCKPEPAIYRHLMQTYGLAGPDTVFIDDTEANLAAAACFGLHTIRFESPAQCERDLRVLGCLGAS